MKLKYPISKLEWEWWIDHKFPFIPNKWGISSNYYLIGHAESGFDVYLAFTDESNSKVWIEKANKIAMPGMIYFEGLESIDDNEEFNKAHQFFIDKGILDGKENTREDI